MGHRDELKRLKLRLPFQRHWKRRTETTDHMEESLHDHDLTAMEVLETLLIQYSIGGVEINSIPLSMSNTPIPWSQYLPSVLLSPNIYIHHDSFPGVDKRGKGPDFDYPKSGHEGIDGIVET